MQHQTDLDSLATDRSLCLPYSIRAARLPPAAAYSRVRMQASASAGHAQALPCASTPPAATPALLLCIESLHSPRARLPGGTNSQLKFNQQASPPFTGDPSTPAHLQSALPLLQLHLQSLQARILLLQRFAQLGQLPGCLVCLGLQAHAGAGSHSISLQGLVQQRPARTLREAYVEQRSCRNCQRLHVGEGSGCGQLAAWPATACTHMALTI